MPDKKIETLPDLIKEWGPDLTAWPAATATYLMRLADEHRSRANWFELRAERGEQRSVSASESRIMAAHNKHAEELEGAAQLVGEEEREASKRVDAAARAYAAVGATGPDYERRSGGAMATARGGEGVYGRGTGGSFFLDLARQRMTGDPEATRRLMRHAEETDRMTRDGRYGQEYRTNPNRTDGTGGYFVPPVYLIDEYVSLARPARTVANLPTRQDLPAGTDSINIPKVATGTATGVQTADAAAVTSVDLTDAVLTAPVRTIAGQQDIALQLLDQSPVNFDQVIFQDLIADLNQKLDIQVINGSGTNGQGTGILQTSGINAVTFTSASPTLQLLYPILTQAKSQVEKNIFMPVDAIVMHPSIWNWCLGQLDGASGTAGRPLIDSSDSGFNAMGAMTGPLPSAQGSVGALLNVPVYSDANIPTNLGGGSNESRILVCRFAEQYLWESNLRTRSLIEPLSGTLQVRIQVYQYFAYLSGRRPTSISAISGTGVIPQTGW